jgi:hypothetical protein
MATNLTHHHLHHAYSQAEKHKKKWEAYREKFSAVTEGAIRLVEVGGGAWLGGMLEAKTGQGTFMHVPINLGIGVALSAAGFLDLAGEYSEHLNNVGDGFIASYAAATGYNFGKNWKETGKLFGARSAPAPLPSPAAAPPVPAPHPAAAAAGWG